MGGTYSLIKTITANPQFSAFSIIMRLVFFAIAVVSEIAYLVSFVKIPNGESIIEQKMILVLGILQIMFNDPFYGITILAPNAFSSFLSVFFVVNFAIFIIFLWIIFFDRIHK